MIRKLEELLRSKKIVTREEVKKLCWWSSTSLIQSLEKKGFVIHTNYDEYVNPISYELIKFDIPLRDIIKISKVKYPDFIDFIREEFSKINK